MSLVCCGGCVGCTAVVGVVIERLSHTWSRAKVRAMLGKPEEKYPLNIWIDQYHEEAIEPEMEMIDPHHHLWDPRTQPKWPLPQIMVKWFYFSNAPAGVTEQCLTNVPAAMKNTFGSKNFPPSVPYNPEDVLYDIRNRDSGMRGHNIVKTVYVECGWLDQNVAESLQPVSEAKYFAAVNNEFRHCSPLICSGIIAAIDLASPHAQKTLLALKEIPSVVALRNGTAYTKDVGITSEGDEKKHKNGKAMSDPKFRENFATLPKYGYIFETWCYHEQLGELTELAKAFPDQVIMVDHIALPLGKITYRRETTWPIWKEGIEALAAASPNVHVKLSGLNMPCCGFGFDERDKPPTSDEAAEAYKPYFKVVLDAFGVSRCMFSSNFPPDKASIDYTVMFNAYKKIVKDYSDADKRALFHDNAKQMYKL